MNAEIVTYTGKIFDLLNPKPEMVCIEDIAHSLAYQCRYTGHTRFFHSVAQHCVLMAENSELPGDPLKKLLHDASEAYISDISRPLKNLLCVKIPQLAPMAVSIDRRFTPVRAFEDTITEVIGQALGVDLSHSAEVKEADIRMGLTEIRDIMPVMPPDFSWGYDKGEPVKERICSWTPEDAECQFLFWYDRLTEGKYDQ